MRHRFWLSLGAAALVQFGGIMTDENRGSRRAFGAVAWAQEAETVRLPATVVTEIANNPVAFLTVLDAISAHYIAGIDSYMAGDRQRGAGFMTAPIADIWEPVEDLFRARGVRSVEPDMQHTASLAQQEGLPWEVQEGAIKVFAGLRAAASRAPGKPRALAVQAKVIAADLDTAARYYQVFVERNTAEFYVLGYGYYKAAKVRFESIAPILAQTDKDAAREVQEALAVLKTAFRSVQVPDKPADDPGMVAAIVTRIVALSDEIR